MDNKETSQGQPLNVSQGVSSIVKDIRSSKMDETLLQNSLLEDSRIIDGSSVSPRKIVTEATNKQSKLATADAKRIHPTPQRPTKLPQKLEFTDERKEKMKQRSTTVNQWAGVSSRDYNSKR